MSMKKRSIAARSTASEPIEALINPSRDCSQAPFWFWNGPMDARQMRQQVRMMAQQGVYGAMPHPRFGMDRREYLEEPYWKAMQATVDEAVRQDMQVMLYDEYNWPSGGAGGRVTDGHPEFYPRGIDYVARDVQGPAEITIDRPAPSEPTYSRFEAVTAAFLVPADCPMRMEDTAGAMAEGGLEARPWGTIAADASSVSGSVPPGRHRVLVFFQALAGNPSPLDGSSAAFVDYMSDKATRRFIELTHERYRKRLGRHFGKTIPCIFTDEPQALSAGPIPWTHDFAGQFIRRCGYDLVPRLPGLVDDRYPDGWRHRANYWRTVAELIDERFLAPISRWCRRNRIAMTGHVYEENIALWQMSGHLMNALRRLDWPGMDALGERLPMASAKIAVSVAHLEGRAHFLCEALGLARGWNVTLGVAKRGYNALALAGVDVLVPHAFHQTVETPRMECPPSYFYQNPYWKYYKTLADMTSRLCAFNRGGVHCAPVAVYYPIESLWSDSTGGKGQGARPWETRGPGNAWAKRTVETFNHVVNRLSAGEVDCDVVDVKALLSGRLQDGSIRIGPETFHCIVVPAARTIDPRAMARLDEFASAGGTVIFVGQFPQRYYPDGDGLPKDMVNGWLHGETPAVGRSWRQGQGTIMLIAPEADPCEAIPPSVPRNIRFVAGQNGHVFAAVRRSEEAAFWLIVNDDHDDVDLTVELPAHLLPRDSRERRLIALDPVTGETRRLDFQSLQSGLLASIHLGDTQAMILVCDDGRETIAGLQPYVQPLSRSAIRPADVPWKPWTFQLAPRGLDKKWAASLAPEAVAMPVWKLKEGPIPPSEPWQQPDYDDSAWESVAAVRGQAPRLSEVVLLRSILPPGATAIRLPLPVSGEYILHVNGRLVEKRLGPPGTGRLDISRFCRGVGDVVAIETGSLSGLSGLEKPVDVLCGPVAIESLRGWDAMHLDWYCGRAIYRTEFRLPAGAKDGLVLDLGEVRHYAEVWVNGKLAGPLVWPPYVIPISRHVRAGRNELAVVVSNSAAARFQWDSWGTRSGQGWGLTLKNESWGLLGPVCLGHIAGR